VVDGRPELVHNIQSAPKDVRSYIAFRDQETPRHQRVLDALPDFLLPDSD
jgi:hypothetical protein